MRVLKNIKRPEQGFESWQQISEQDIIMNLNAESQIGVVVAMKSEILQVINQLNHYKEYKVDGFEFYTGSLTCNIDKVHQKIIQLVIGISGPGKVNAALCTEIMIELFEADCILNVGIVGAISKNLNVYDMVVARDVVQADIDTTAVGDEMGLVSRLNVTYFGTDTKLTDKAFGICEKLPKTEDVKQKRDAELQADKEYFEDIYKKMGPPIPVGMVNETICKSYTTVNLNYKKPNRIIGGLVATTDSFIATDEQKKRIIDSFPATLVCDMELGAIAQTCYIKEIPLVSVKLISDNADNSAQESITEVLKTASSVFLIFFENYLYSVYEQLING